MLNYYIAEIRAVACIIDIRVNDMPLFKQQVKGSITCTIPINHLLDINSIQQLSVNMLPYPFSNTANSESECEVEIRLCDATQQYLEPISEVTSITLTNEDLTKQPPHTFEQRLFNAHVGTQSTRWFECMDLTEIQSLREVLTIFYKKVGNLLQTRQFDKYAEIVSRREKYVVEALYLDEREIKTRQNQLIEDLDEGYTMLPLSGNEIVQLYANGKAAALLLSDFKSALRFINKNDESSYISIELLVGMNEKTHQLMVI